MSTASARHQPEVSSDTAVVATGLLDAAPDPRYDRVTELARTLWHAPISTVTLLHRDRAYFASRSGIDVTEAPRQETFCSTVVALDAPVVVPDAEQDDRFAHLGSVSGPPHLRFYAGHPVRDAWGTPVGTICVYDVVPREFSEHDLEVLAGLAAIVEAELRTTTDREQALAVQRALLPERVTPVPGYSFAATCVPTGLVAGDSFDHLPLTSGHYVMVADVMGKGTGAALLMAVTRTALRSAAVDLDAGVRADLGDAVTHAHEVVSPELEAAGAFVTAFVAWAQPEDGTLRYVDAGHGLALLVHPDGTWDRLASDELPLGIDADGRWREHVTLTGAGDTLVVFSDGLLDVVDGDDPYGAVAALTTASGGPRGLVRAVEALTRGHATADDVTVLVVRRDLEETS